jgi:hypothetical protein
VPSKEGGSLELCRRVAVVLTSSIETPSMKARPIPGMIDAARIGIGRSPRAPEQNVLYISFDLALHARVTASVGLVAR